MQLYDSPDGVEFFWSENGVLLTTGNTEGMLLPKYFSRALRLKPTSKQNYCTKQFLMVIFLFLNQLVLYSREPPAAAVAADAGLPLVKAYLTL